MISKSNILDVFGQAILDCLLGDKAAIITTETSISEPDELPVSYLFRTYDEMPKIEQKALDLASGKVLDIGCGAGSHTLYLQNTKNLDIIALDNSNGAINSCVKRGIKQAVCKNILSYNQEKFNTILLLMNGVGLVQSKAKLLDFLKHLKGLLTENGQILLDSSDIKYMYDKTDLEELDDYYGDLMFTISYKTLSTSFPWLFIDFENLKTIAAAVNLKCEKVITGENHDYLAKLTKIT